MQTQAVVFTANHQVSLQPVTIPEPKTGEVIVQAEYSCISPGTEGRLLAGTIAEAAPYPYIAGYSLTGKIIAVGADCRFQIGQCVWCTGTSQADVNLTWGGHSAHALAPESDLILLPDNLSTLEASIGRLAAIAYHGVRVSIPQPHEKVALVGLGPIGMLSALCHAASGSDVVVTDRVPERVALAEKLGLRGFVACDSLAEGFARFFPQGADLLVDGTGLPNIAEQLIPAAKNLAWDNSLYPRGARYLIMGSCDSDYVFPQPPAFDKEISFLSSRDRQPRDVAAAFDLISRGKLPVADLISAVRAPESAPQAYADLQNKRSQLMTIAFQWS